MGKAGDAWSDASQYAASVAGVGEQAARDRGVPDARMRRMRGALELLREGDPDAFYAAINVDYAAPASAAVASCLAMRAEVEQEREALSAASTPGPPIGDDDPTPAT